MRRIPLLVAVLVIGGLWPDRVEAQVCAAETWTLSPNGTECTTSNRGRLDANKETCARFGLAAGDTDATQCTQAQACGAPAIPGFPACAGGSGCNASQAIACGRRIYPNSTAGREQWAGVDVVRPALAAVEARHAPQPPTGSDFRAWCLNFWIPALQTARDVECTRAALPPSCNICPLTF
jgi:hypothetical protein